jgi:hypothetical protein
MAAGVIREGLSVIENWDSASKDIFHGKSGELTGEAREGAEMSALVLRLVQAGIGYLTTLRIQIVLAEPAWRDRLTGNGRRGLSALFLDQPAPLRPPGARSRAAPRAAASLRPCSRSARRPCRSSSAC